MCGIAGIISDTFDKQKVYAMGKMINHRGPDAKGYFFENDVAFVHNRLSIIDLSEAANQPFHSTNGEWVIIFNGEIYNYKELKAELEKEGYGFRTNSDTEVIVNSFRAFGVDAVQRFIGMFAFAIYHRPTKTSYIYRDRVGVKPLYYYWKNGVFCFASELKALIPILPEKEINQEALGDFFRFGYVRNCHSIFTNVYKLQPGHYATIAAKQLRITKYWDLEEKINDREPVDEANATLHLEELMQSSFNYRMVSDVPVGVFLSGGIDSSVLTAILAKSNSNLKTFSIGFDDEKYNEAPHAGKIARFIKTDHHEKILTASEAEKVLDKYFSIYDEPFADSSGIPVYLVSQFAKQNGCKVVLSADGGDELFGGYERYSTIPKLYERLNKTKPFHPFLKQGLRFLSDLQLNQNNFQHRANKLMDLVGDFSETRSGFYESYVSINSEYSLNKLFAGNVPLTTEKEFERLSFEEKMMLWDFRNYLPEDLLAKVDRASMATSIEAREPFLDHRLVEYVYNLPLSYRTRHGYSKYLLKQVLYKYIPASYFERRKMGFSIPLFKWFSEKLDNDFEAVFTPEVTSNIPVLDSKTVLAEYEKYKYFKSRQKEYNILFVWHLYVFMKWWLKWM